MNKIVIVGDTHLSRRAENPLIKKYIEEGQEKFFDLLDEYMKREGITTVVFTGDIFDTRTSINVKSLVNTIRLFKTKFKDYAKHVILGNHDLYYDNSYEISSLELLSDCPNTHLYLKSVAKIDLLGKTWYMVPWVIKENEEKFTKFLETLSTKPSHVKDNTCILGHFDTIGIDMESGNKSVVGLDPNLLYNACKLTISGHFHGKSVNKKIDSTILYVGTPYPLTFANSDQQHGFWVVDEDLNFEFVENTLSPNFKTITDDHDLDNLPDLKNSFVRFYFDKNKKPEDIVMDKMKIEAKTPILINSIPYNSASGVQLSVVDEDESTANEYLHMDINTLAGVFLKINEELVPVTKYYPDATVEILSRIKNYSAEIA